MQGDQIVIVADIDWIKVEQASSYDGDDFQPGEPYLEYLRREAVSIFDQLIDAGWEIKPPQKSNHEESGHKKGYLECLNKYAWMLEGLLYDEDVELLNNQTL